MVPMAKIDFTLLSEARRQNAAHSDLAEWPDEEVLHHARLTSKQLKRCLTQWGSRAAVASALRRNPYQLLKIDTFGWNRVDTIAKRLAIADDDPRRLAALVTTAFQINSNGDCYLTGEQSISAVMDKPFSLSYVDAITALESAHTDGSFVQDDEYVWLPETERAEQVVADFVHDSVSGRYDGELDPEWVEQFNPSNEQQEGVRALLGSELAVITGPAGTGKTTALRGVVATVDCLLMSFTGKAALRMREVTGHEATTIHKFLWLVRGMQSAAREDPEAEDELADLHGKLIVVDEASMLSLELAAWLFGVARSMGSSVALLGDVHQLPSIGAGQVFYDIIRSGAVPVVTLTRNFRSEEIHGLGAGADAVLAGSVPTSGDGLMVLSMYQWAVVPTILDYYRGAVASQSMWADAPALVWQNSVQVKLNDELQRIRNPNGREWIEHWAGSERRGQVKRRLRVGDPVTHLHNDALRGLVNGSRGVITKIEMIGLEAKITVDYDGTTSVYDSREYETDDIGLSYASTTHKSQGSEYPLVVVCLPYANANCEKALLYTAMTRGKEHVLIVSTPEALETTVRNNKSGKRRTRLVERILDTT